MFTQEFKIYESKWTKLQRPQNYNIYNNDWKLLITSL